MNQQYLIELNEQILYYSRHDNLDEATLALMDFARERTESEDHLNEAMVIREKFITLHDSISQMASGDAVKIKFAIIDDILEFLRKLEQEVHEAQGCNTVVENFEERIFADTSSTADERRPILEAKAISKNYDQFTLDPINLSCYAGEILAIVGENGSGKSTLLNLLAGKVKPDAGDIIYGFANPTNWYDTKRRIGYHEPFNPYNRATMLHYLQFVAAANSRTFDAAKRIIVRLRLEQYTGHHLNELSTGYKTRFNLARILLCEPSLLILDEPLAYLDLISQQLFLKDLIKFSKSQKNPMTIVITSQNLSEIESIADKILLLENGKTSFYGTKSEINKNSTKNYYEVEGGFDIKHLASLLVHLDPSIKIVQWGTYFVMTTSLSITPDLLLDFFVRNAIDIKYFRNVSNSIKSRFYC